MKAPAGWLRSWLHLNGHFKLFTWRIPGTTRNHRGGSHNSCVDPVEVPVVFFVGPISSLHQRRKVVLNIAIGWAQRHLRRMLFAICCLCNCTRIQMRLTWEKAPQPVGLWALIWEIVTHELHCMWMAVLVESVFVKSLLSVKEYSNPTSKPSHLAAAATTFLREDHALYPWWAAATSTPMWFWHL